MSGEIRLVDLDCDKAGLAAQFAACLRDVMSAWSEQDGAMIKMRGESNNGVKLNTTLPKRLKVHIPFGDPDCECDVEFAVQVMVGKDGTASFRLRHLISDGAFDAYAVWMREQLKALPEGWLILVGV